MTPDEAAWLVGAIREQHGLYSLVVHEGGSVSVDVALPPQGEERSVTLTVEDLQDWVWLFDTHVAPRLRGE